MSESWKLSDATWLRKHYDRLKAENEMRIQDHLKTCKEFDQLTTERDYHKAMAIEYRADLNKALAERDVLQADYDKLFVVKHNLEVDNERLRAELAELNKVYHVGIGDRMQLETQLTELREAAEELAYEALCVAEPSELLVSKAHAVLAKVKP